MSFAFNAEAQYDEALYGHGKRHAAAQDAHNATIEPGGANFEAENEMTSQRSSLQCLQ
jgi:hypothetical protein